MFIFRYERAFVDFFEDELVRLGYDWRKLVADYLFSGKEPMISSILSDRTFLKPRREKRRQKLMIQPSSRSSTNPYGLRIRALQPNHRHRSARS